METSGSTQRDRVFRFGPFELSECEGELRKNGVRIKLQEQPFRVLLELVASPGKVVAREDLQQKLWAADTFVDFDVGLNSAIRKLRQALNDDADHPHYIETLAKRGYRFLAHVTVATPMQPVAELAAMSVETTALRSAGAAAPPSKRSYRTAKVLVASLVICAAAASFVYKSPLIRAKKPEPTLSLAVTSVGEKYGPSLSPDGRQLAYAWNGGSGPHFSIYVKLIGTEESLRLTRQGAVDFDPVWSPDGRYVAFCRIQKGQTGIYIVSAFGGAERKVRETHWEEREFYEVFWYFGRLSWSPDGKSLAFSDRLSSNEPTGIFLLSLDTLAVRRVTSPGLPGDYNPAFSPDGRTLAFDRGSQGITSIYTLPVGGGEEQRLASGSQYGWGLAWTADGRSIVFGRASWLGSSGWLWKISAQGGEPERLQFGQEGSEPSIRGNRLAYARQLTNLNIWKRTLDASQSVGPSKKFLTSTTIESGPQFSPNGKKIVFESTRSGASEVWLCESDGSNLVQLTHLNTVTGTPRWSPDGDQIAFDSRAPGNADIFIVDSGGSSIRQLTQESSTDVIPSWSRDRHWVYFASDRSGDWQIWKMPAAGGAAIQVTQHGGYGGFESADGKFFYYAKGGTVPGIWRIPTSGGEETEVVGALDAGYWGYWALADNGIYYLDTAATPAMNFFSLATLRTTRVFDFESHPARESTGIAVSPDGKTILYTQIDALSRDIVLVENYR